MIYSVSSESTIGIVSFACLQYIGCWLWTDQCSGYLFTGYLFPALFANQILICFMPAAHVSPILSSSHLWCVGWLWTSHCFGFIVSGNVRSTCTLGLSCSILLVQWLLLWTCHRLNTFIFHLGTVYLHHFK